jgi:Cu-Zn family superoxide dismutase
LILALLVSPFSGGGSPAPAVAQAPAPGPRVINLPDSISFPEGVAYDVSAGVLYTGSGLDAALLRIKPETGAAALVKPGGSLVPAGTTIFPVLLGMKVDGSRRLWVAGGRTGHLWVIDTRDGGLIKQVTVPSVGKSLINDVALAGNAGYFTDTFVPTLWRLSAEGGVIGDLDPWLNLQGTPIQYGEGRNLNGIAATPDGRALIVVQMDRGLLFKIDVGSKAVRPIDTGGADLSAADGLVLDGNLLYVVRQNAVEIATLRLDDELTRGTVISRFTDATLAWPATAVKVGADLIVVNTQFNARANDTATRPFTLVRVPISRLGAR